MHQITAIDCFLSFGLVVSVVSMVAAAFYVIARGIVTCVVDIMTDYFNALSHKAEEDFVHWMEAGCQPGKRIANPTTKFE